MTRDQLVEEIMTEMKEASKSNWAEFIIRSDLGRLVKQFEEYLLDSIADRVRALRSEVECVSLDDVLNQIY